MRSMITERVQTMQAVFVIAGSGAETTQWPGAGKQPTIDKIQKCIESNLIR